MNRAHETREEVGVESTDPEYAAPKIEVVLTPEELAREVQYAGVNSNPGR